MHRRRRHPRAVLEAVQPEHLAVLGQRVDGRLLLPDPLGGGLERVAQLALEPAAAVTPGPADACAPATTAATVGRDRSPLGRPVAPLGDRRHRGRAVRPAVLLALLVRHQVLGRRPVHHFLSARVRVHLRHAHVSHVPGRFARGRSRRGRRWSAVGRRAVVAAVVAGRARQRRRHGTAGGVGVPAGGGVVVVVVDGVVAVGQLQARVVLGGRTRGRRRRWGVPRARFTAPSSAVDQIQNGVSY